MGEMDFDLNLAMLKRNTEGTSDDNSFDEIKEFYDNQMSQMMDRISKFTFKKILFCNGLFSMLMPSELFGGPMVMENICFFQSQKEKMAMVIKTVDSEQIIDFKGLKDDYITQMHNSKQQTQIDISGSEQIKLGTVHYFSAIHAMPGGGLCDFIILFQSQSKIIMIDFNFDQKDYFFWKPILSKLSATIQLEGEKDI